MTAINNKYVCNTNSLNEDKIKEKNVNRIKT